MTSGYLPSTVGGGDLAAELASMATQAGRDGHAAREGWHARRAGLKPTQEYRDVSQPESDMRTGMGNSSAGSWYLHR
jgi:hypothetical protein